MEHLVAPNVLLKIYPFKKKARNVSGDPDPDPDPIRPESRGPQGALGGLKIRHKASDDASDELSDDPIRGNGISHDRHCCLLTTLTAVVHYLLT